jgi:hypothetical protein
MGNVKENPSDNPTKPANFGDFAQVFCPVFPKKNPKPRLFWQNFGYGFYRFMRV